MNIHLDTTDWAFCMDEHIVLTPLARVLDPIRIELGLVEVGDASREM